MLSSGAHLDSIHINSSLVKSPVPEIAYALNSRSGISHSAMGSCKSNRSFLIPYSNMTDCFILFCFGFGCLVCSLLFSNLLKCRTKSLVFHQEKPTAEAFCENNVGTYTTALCVGIISNCSIHYLQYVAFLHVVIQ